MVSGLLNLFKTFINSDFYYFFKLAWTQLFGFWRLTVLLIRERLGFLWHNYAI